MIFNRDLAMQVAMVLTVYSLVLCKRLSPGFPERFTIPVMEISPIAGSFLFTPIPGYKGALERVIRPTSE